jgi:trimethylamine--corrinoid protein Co-methyltransferase
MPLGEGELRRIHGAALDILERIGIGNPIPSCVVACTAGDGSRAGRGHGGAPRRFPVCGRDPRQGLEPWGTRVYFGTAGAAVHVVEPATRAYRESELRDRYDAARLVDALEHVHFFQQPLVARDMTNSLELDVNKVYACLAGTTKHIGTSFVRPEHLERTLPLLHRLAGSEAAWRAAVRVALLLLRRPIPAQSSPTPGPTSSTKPPGCWRASWASRTRAP